MQSNLEVRSAFQPLARDELLKVVSSHGNLRIFQQFNSVVKVKLDLQTKYCCTKTRHAGGGQLTQNQRQKQEQEEREKE